MPQVSHHNSTSYSNTTLRHHHNVTISPPVTVIAKSQQSNGKRPNTIIVYPTVSPESIAVPIVSCIFGFPLLALTVICCLRKRAKLARDRARRRNCELDRAELSVVRLSPVNSRSRSAGLLRSPRALPSLELDTVVEERSDPEQTQTSQIEMATPEHDPDDIIFCEKQHQTLKDS